MSQLAHLFCEIPKLFTGHMDGAAIRRSAVHELYAQVANEPNGSFDFHFHRGSDYAATLLRYDIAELAKLPTPSTQSFVGVANPHLIGPIHSGETVLDIGSGAGMDLLLAAQRVGTSGRAFGIDMTREMVERCQASIQQMRLHNANVTLADAEELPLDSQSVDVVISNGVLNLIYNKERTLAEIFRVLRPGGRLMLGDLVMSSSLGQLLSGSSRLWALCVGGAYREQDLVTLVRQEGFTDVAVTDRFDCVRGITTERIAHRLGIQGVNLFARKA